MLSRTCIRVTITNVDMIILEICFHCVRCFRYGHWFERCEAMSNRGADEVRVYLSEKLPNAWNRSPGESIDLVSWRLYCGRTAFRDYIFTFHQKYCRFRRQKFELGASALKSTTWPLVHALTSPSRTVCVKWFTQEDILTLADFSRMYHVLLYQLPRYDCVHFFCYIQNHTEFRLAVPNDTTTSRWNILSLNVKRWTEQWSIMNWRILRQSYRNRGRTLSKTKRWRNAQMLVLTTSSHHAASCASTRRTRAVSTAR